MRRVLNEDGGDEWRTLDGLMRTTKFRGFSKVNLDKKRGQFQVDHVRSGIWGHKDRPNVSDGKEQNDFEKNGHLLSWRLMPFNEGSFISSS